jgi:hypothetical protein
MNNINTSCKKCYFAQEASSEKSCEFYIPDAVSNAKKIEIIDNYNYIHNYLCKYGISNDKANEIETNKNDINIKEYAKNRVAPKYDLFYIADITDDIENICNQIIKLEIKPECINLAFRMGHDMGKIQSVCDRILGKSVAWKLHYFLEDKQDYEILQISTSTDERLSSCQFIWIVNREILELAIKKDSINRINYIVNVDQPDLAILMSQSSSDYFYGIFLTIENMNGIYKNISANLGEAIKESYMDNISYYD